MSSGRKHSYKHNKKKKLTQFKAGNSLGYLQKSANPATVPIVRQSGGGNQSCSRSSRPDICPIVRPTEDEYSDALQMQATNTGGSSTLTILSKLRPKKKRIQTKKILKHVQQAAQKEYHCQSWYSQ